MTIGSPTAPPQLGLRPNLAQFTLLALDNVCVGMLIGSERTVVPLLGQQSFHVTSFVVLLSFIAAFGVVKGPLNLLAGRLAYPFRGCCCWPQAGGGWSSQTSFWESIRVLPGR